MSNAIISPYFFFNDTATTEIYTLSLHDALPILMELALAPSVEDLLKMLVARSAESPELISLQIWLVQKMDGSLQIRSEEHTSELQSQSNLVCRLLLANKKRDHPRLPVSSSELMR